MRLHIPNRLALRHRTRNIIVLASTAAVCIFTLQHLAIFTLNFGSLVVAAEHEVFEVDFGSFKPFVRVDEPPDEDEEL